MFWLSAITFKCHFYWSKTCMYRSLLIPSLKQSCIYTIVSSFVRLSASFYNDNNWYFDLGQTDAECLLDGIRGYTAYYCDTDSLKHLLVFIKVVKLVESVFSVRTFLFDSDEDNRDLTTGGVQHSFCSLCLHCNIRALSLDNSHNEHRILNRVWCRNHKSRNTGQILRLSNNSQKKWAMHAGWS